MLLRTEENPIILMFPYSEAISTFSGLYEISPRTLNSFVIAEDGATEPPKLCPEPDSEDSDAEKTTSSRVAPEVTGEAAAAVARLHGDQLPGVNGSLDNEQIFKEWHQVVQQDAYLQQPLPLLPYVLLDF